MMALTFWVSMSESITANYSLNRVKVMYCHFRETCELIKKHLTIPVNDLIKIMNPKLRGGMNYYRHCVAKKVFGYVGHQIFWMGDGQLGVIQLKVDTG
jgi:hypothetical protein